MSDAQLQQPSPGDKQPQAAELLSLSDPVRAKLATSMDGGRMECSASGDFQFKKRRETVEDSILVSFKVLRLGALYICDISVKDGEAGRYYDLKDLRLYLGDATPSEGKAPSGSEVVRVEGEYYSLKAHEIRFRNLQYGHSYVFHFEGDDPWVGAKMPHPPLQVREEPERSSVVATEEINLAVAARR